MFGQPTPPVRKYSAVGNVRLEGLPPMLEAAVSISKCIGLRVFLIIFVVGGGSGGQLIN